MNIDKLVSDYLKLHGYDGLWNSEAECACLKEDLAPCGTHDFDECKPGVSKPCDGGLSGCPCDWHIGPRPELTEDEKKTRRIVSESIPE